MGHEVYPHSGLVEHGSYENPISRLQGFLPILPAVIGLLIFTAGAKPRHSGAAEPLAKPCTILIALAATEADAGRTAIRVHLDHGYADLMRRDDALVNEADREHHEAPGVCVLAQPVRPLA